MNKIQAQNTLGVLYLMSKPKDGVFKHRIRLQKFILLAKERFEYPFVFKYKNYYYGPYSEELQKFITELIQGGLVKEYTNELSNGNFEFFYELTELGEKKVRELSLRHKDITKKLDSLWLEYSGKPTSSIVKAAKKALAKIAD